MRQSQRIVLGTRGSELARVQTGLVKKALRAAFPGMDLAVQIIATTGDKSSSSESFDPRAGRKGIFTTEIEQALRRGEIDVAVHSAKDLPSGSPQDLEICATLPRAAFDDALILKEITNLTLLPHGAIVATGSVRRQHQLRWKRPDLCLVDLRGNVPTRLRKLVESDWDAVILARAGLERLGHDVSKHAFEFEGRSLHLEFLSSTDFLPAGGQGTIAIQTRVGDEMVKKCVRAVNDSTTLLALRAEREFLGLLQGDCNSPVGVLSRVQCEAMTLQAQIFEAPIVKPKIGKVTFSLQEKEPEQIAAALHALMYGQR
jgi:hydroxymethylbilane synthase